MRQPQFPSETPTQDQKAFRDRKSFCRRWFLARLHGVDSSANDARITPLGIADLAVLSLCCETEIGRGRKKLSF